MGKVVISVSDLWKQYRLGTVGRGTIGSDLKRWWFRTSGKEDPFLKVGEINDRTKKGESDLVWALQDISFEVREGEILGIIGKNGAGKSTLLKILSRVTSPTKGLVKIRGRMSSLLEVGTGFHPDLSGRENVYLNGTILGMKRAEIKSKFDEIVEFSGVERYIDTPVKRYSSGMYVRLAFAVAAHLDPEILILDEVLAVGDVAFQNKCIRKIGEVSTEGKTCLLVSHNMNSISRLCNSALLLHNGQLLQSGNPSDIIKEYLSLEKSVASEVNWTNIETAPGNQITRLMGIRVRDESGVKDAFDIRKPIFIDLDYMVMDEDVNITPGFHLFNSESLIVFISSDNYKIPYGKKKKGFYRSTCMIPGNFLAEGDFRLRISLSTIHQSNSPVVHVDEKEIVSFQVVDRMEGGSARGNHSGAYFGVVRPILDWNTQSL